MILGQDRLDTVVVEGVHRLQEPADDGRGVRVAVGHVRAAVLPAGGASGAGMAMLYGPPRRASAAASRAENSCGRSASRAARWAPSIASRLRRRSFTGASCSVAACWYPA